jgi:hypothetical protein
MKEFMFKMMEQKGFMRGFLAVIWSLFYFGFTVAVTFTHLTPEERQTAHDMQMLSVGFIAGYMTFYFGTSQGSVDKSKIINRENELK